MALRVLVGIFALLLGGFIVYDILDLAVGAWMIFGGVLLGAVSRLIGWIPGADLDFDGDGGS
jgi:hypothetical protein